tara:strand:+ start:330 stop:563 length:234 start_codon:yes stop_codon:yes gene_type:complete
MKTKMFIIFIVGFFLTLQSYAFARVITVDRCTIPFDFTIGSICVLGTLSLWIIVPLLIGLIFGFFQIILHFFKKILN